MAQEKIGFDITVNGVERTITSFKDLKKATKDLRDEQLVMSQKFGDTSVEATNAAKKIAELKDKVDDLNDSSKSLKGTGFEMLKQGFGQVQEGLMNLDFDKVKTGLTAMGSGFVSMGKAAMTSLQGIKGAIAATGIGLLVIALGVIYAYWDDIKGVVDGLTPELKKQNDLANENLKTQQDKLNAISGQENILKLQGKTEKEILQLKMKQTDEAIAASDIAIAQAEQTKKAQVEASQRNKLILQGIIAFVTAPLTALLYAIDLAGSAFGKDFGLAEGFTGGIAKMMFNPDEVAAEGDKSIEAAKAVNAKLKNDRAGLQLSINAIDTKAAEDKKKLLEQGSKDSKEAADKQVDYQVELQGKLKELQTQLIVDEQEKEQTILKNKFLADQKDLYNKGANAELLKALNDNFEKDKLEISKKFKKIKEDADKEVDKKELQVKLSNLESGYQLQLEKLKGNDAEKLILQKKHLEEIYKINIANAELLGLNTTDLTNKYLQEKEALENAARDKKTEADKKAEADEKARKTQLHKDILESVNIAAQTTLSVQKTLSDTYYLKESQKNNKLYADKLKNVRQGSKEEKAILEQKASDEKDLARKQFETQKKFNRASAILNGILGLGAIFAIPDPTLGILSAIRAVALVATTAANIAAINATQFDEGGATAGGIPAAADAPTTSQAPAIYGPGQGQSTTFSGNQNNNFAPVKAYVVETENRSTTNRVNKLVSESTYG
jgi:hypothetical protein